MYGTDAADNESGLALAGKINGKVVVCLDLDARLVGIKFANHLYALLGGEPGFLFVVHPNADDDFVHKGQGTLHHGIVPDSKRVECARKYRSFHH